MKRHRNLLPSSEAEEECPSGREDLANPSEGTLEHIVDAASLDGYRCILYTCENSAMLCPYLLDTHLPVFNERVLRGMHAQALADVFRLFVEHRCAGRPFFLRMLRHFPFVDERVVDVFWTQTAPMWQPVDIPLLQQTAIYSSHPWLLRKLRSRWDASLVPRGALHMAGNVEACQMLLQHPRFMVNNTQDWYGAGIIPLYSAQSKEVASYLLDCSGDVAKVLECSEWLPRLEVMQWIFELCSVDRVWNALWSPAAFFAKKHADSMLDIVGLLSKFGCSIALDAIPFPHDEAKCALLTHGYLAALPEGTEAKPAWLKWRPRTHRYLVTFHDIVQCVLLCWKRICPALPRDLRIHILSLALE